MDAAARAKALRQAAVQRLQGAVTPKGVQLNLEELASFVAQGLDSDRTEPLDTFDTTKHQDVDINSLSLSPSSASSPPSGPGGLFPEPCAKKQATTTIFARPGGDAIPTSQVRTPRPGDQASSTDPRLPQLRPKLDRPAGPEDSSFNDDAQQDQELSLPRGASGLSANTAFSRRALPPSSLELGIERPRLARGGQQATHAVVIPAIQSAAGTAGMSISSSEPPLESVMRQIQEFVQQLTTSDFERAPEMPGGQIQEPLEVDKAPSERPFRLLDAVLPILPAEATSTPMSSLPQLVKLPQIGSDCDLEKLRLNSPFSARASSRHFLAPKSARGQRTNSKVSSEMPEATPLGKGVCVPRSDALQRALKCGQGHVPDPNRFDLLAFFSRTSETAVALAAYLELKDIINLFSVSRDFHSIIRSSLGRSMTHLAQLKTGSDIAYRVFHPSLYLHLCVPDPDDEVDEFDSAWGETKRGKKRKTQTGQKTVPGLRWMQMAVSRHDMCRDILALLARAGFRTPPGTLGVLMKLWSVCDLPTTHERKMRMRSQWKNSGRNHNDGDTPPPLFEDAELAWAQLFFVKLALRFNDPVCGPGVTHLVHLVLSVRGGFIVLWEMLMGRGPWRARSNALLQLAVQVFGIHSGSVESMWSPSGLGTKIGGVLVDKVGRAGLEHWGQGDSGTALIQLDEVVVHEAVRRGLRLERHLMHFAVWGCISVPSGANSVPTADEVWMSASQQAPSASMPRDLIAGSMGSETRLRLPTISPINHYNEFHDMESRWDTLSVEERRRVLWHNEQLLDNWARADAHMYDDEGLTEEENTRTNIEMADWNTQEKAKQFHDLGVIPPTPFKTKYRSLPTGQRRLIEERRARTIASKQNKKLSEGQGPGETGKIEPDPIANVHNATDSHILYEEPDDAKSVTSTISNYSRQYGYDHMDMRDLPPPVIRLLWDQHRGAYSVDRLNSLLARTCGLVLRDTWADGLRPFRFPPGLSSDESPEELGPPVPEPFADPLAEEHSIFGSVESETAEDWWEELLDEMEPFVGDEPPPSDAERRDAEAAGGDTAAWMHDVLPPGVL